MRLPVLAFFFVSGLCGLLYEVVWIRVAGTVIGNTTYAVGTVVGVFMGGLALGAWAGGRAADRRQGGALLRLYGFLEAGVALSALAVPWLLTASEPLFRWLWNSVGEVTALYAALRILLVGLVLLVPTTLMGATLPVLSRFLSDSAESAPREAGLAYAVNTFGGVAGTLLSGFWLIPTFGLRVTTLAAAALNLLIGAASVALSRGEPGEVRPTLAPEPPPRPLALWVSAFSGFSALVYEVAWTRSLVLSMGSTVYAFTLILTAFILGLATGSAISSRIIPRLRRPVAALGAIQAAIGLVAIALLPFLGDLPLRVAPVVDAHRSDYGALLRAEFGMIALFVFVPTVLIGAVFPFTFRLASASATAVGRSVAAVYTWNTVGSIAGSLAASFALVPTVGLSASIRIAATLNFAVAAVVFFRDERAKFAAAPALLAVAAWLLPAWNPQVLASGAYLYIDQAKRFGMDLRKYVEQESTIVAKYWDAYGLTTVHAAQRGGLIIRVNGKSDASTSTEDMPTQRMVGHLGLLHHPFPRRALVIGLGSGVTLAAVADHRPERIDCVEISSAGVEAARQHFSDVNGHVLEKPNVHLVIGDGRNAVQFAREPYDVIVSQPSNLWISGMANLFTRDFFEVASKRLTPGGLFCQWVQAYRLPLEDFQTILRTFFAVFPEGSLWEVFPGQDYILLGSAAPVGVGVRDLEKRLADPALASDFQSSDFPPVVSLLGRWVADAAAVRKAAGPAPLLTDDLSSIEYSTSRAMFTRLHPRTLGWLDELRRRPIDPERYPGMDAARVAESRESRRQIASVIVYEAGHERPHEVLEYLTRETGRFGDDPETRYYFDRIAYLTRLEAKQFRLAGRFKEAEQVLAAVPRMSSHYPDALFERALAARFAGRTADAERWLREVVRDFPASFPAAVLLAQDAENEGKLDRALEKWTEAVRLQPESESAHAHLAGCLKRLGRREEARAECRKALELDPSNVLARQLLVELGN